MHTMRQFSKDGDIRKPIPENDFYQEVSVCFAGCPPYAAGEIRWNRSRRSGEQFTVLGQTFLPEQGVLPMRSRLMIPALLAVGFVCLACTTDAKAFGFFGHHGCCAPVVDCCAPSDCQPAKCCPRPHRGFFKSRCCKPACCAPEPKCCAPEPKCCEPDPCCRKRHCGLFRRFHFRHHCCKPACCAPKSSCCD